MVSGQSVSFHDIWITNCCIHIKLDIFPACLPFGLRAPSLWQRRSRSAWLQRYLTTANTRDLCDGARRLHRLQSIPTWGNWRISAERFDPLWPSGKDKVTGQTPAWKERMGGVSFKPHSGVGMGIIHIWEMPLMFTEQYKWIWVHSLKKKKKGITNY